MGGFETHMKYGVTAHVVASAALIGVVYTSPLPLIVALVAVAGLPVTLAGAAFPDIDHPSSKPNRLFRRILGVVGVFTTAYVYGLYGFMPAYAWFQTAGAEGAALPLTSVSVVVLSLCGGAAAHRGFEVVRPPHRGVTHRIPTGVVAALGVGVFVWGLGAVSGAPLPGLLSSVIGSLFLTGFLSHLACDGMLLDIETYTTFT